MARNVNSCLTHLRPSPFVFVVHCGGIEIRPLSLFFPPSSFSPLPSIYDCLVESSIFWAPRSVDPWDRSQDQTTPLQASTTVPFVLLSFSFSSFFFLFPSVEFAGRSSRARNTFARCTCAHCDTFFVARCRDKYRGTNRYEFEIGMSGLSRGIVGLGTRGYVCVYTWNVWACTWSLECWS